VALNRLKHLLVSSLNLELSNSKQLPYLANRNSSLLFLVSSHLVVNNKHKHLNSGHNLQEHFLVSSLQEEVSLEINLNQPGEDWE
jgi:hypothetical protein